MPAGQPFTVLCRALAQPPQLGRADLHLHTTASDGLYTPAQIVDLARRCGLAAIAVTDHDTLAAVTPARQAANQGLEVVAGVEISAEFRGREFHLLGYFVRTDEPALSAALLRLQAGRVERFRAMLDRLGALGVPVDPAARDDVLRQNSPGRRHLAELLVRARRADNVREAFQRWLGDGGRVVVPKTRLPAAEAIALVRGAGGVAAWAHPPYDCTMPTLRELRGLGMNAVEVDFPSCRAGFGRQLRAWAGELKLAVTGGSDCHGPDAPRGGVGSCGISRAELQALREAAI